MTYFGNNDISFLFLSNWWNKYPLDNIKIHTKGCHQLQTDTLLWGVKCSRSYEVWAPSNRSPIAHVLAWVKGNKSDVKCRNTLSRLDQYTVGNPRNVGVQKIPDRVSWKPMVAKRNNTNVWTRLKTRILVTHDSRRGKTARIPWLTWANFSPRAFMTDCMTTTIYNLESDEIPDSKITHRYTAANQVCAQDTALQSVVEDMKTIL